jgi:hypothetical protein
MATTAAELGRTMDAKWGDRVGALAGVTFAVCLFVGVAMLEIPRRATDRDLTAWWSEHGNQISAVVSMYLFVAAGLSFLVFLVELRSRLLGAEAGGGDLIVLVLGSGVVFVAMLFVAGAARGMIGLAALAPANGESLPGPGTLRYLPQIGYAVTGTGGLLAAALTISTTSLVIVRTAVFGRWLAWIGFAATAGIVGASVALSGVFAIPALLIWALATSVALSHPRQPATKTEGDRRDTEFG